MNTTNINYKQPGDELTASEFNQILDAIQNALLDINTAHIFIDGDQFAMQHLYDVDLTGLNDNQVLVWDSTNNKWIVKDYHEHSNKNLLDNIDQELSTTSNVQFNKIKIVEEAYFEQEVSASSNIDWTLGNKQSITLTGDVTLTFTDPSGPCNLILKIVQDSAGGHSVTFPSNVKWEGGNAPDLSTDSGNTVRIVSLYFDGTNYYGQITDTY